MLRESLRLVQCRLPADLHDRLQAVARAEHLSAAAWCRRLIARELGAGRAVAKEAIARLNPTKPRRKSR